jgi:ribosomal protein L30/L7E
MASHNLIYLLALANTPEGSTSIREWTPFPGGDKLYRIIEKHNERCAQGYRQLGLLRDFQSLIELIQVVPHDLSTIGDMNPDYFAKLTILVIDLDAIEKATDVINTIKPRISKYHDHVYHLVQVSQKPDAAPCTQDFEKLPVCPCRPEILRDRAQFDIFLTRLCEVLRTVISSLPSSPSPTSLFARMANRKYAKALPKIASDIRDAAIVKGLSSEETATLTRQAAVQELALSRVAARTRTSTERMVVLDAIREPVSKIAVTVPSQEPALQEVGLVRLSLASPKEELTPWHRKILAGLGVRGKTFTAVHFDQPSTWDRIEPVKEHVKATKFSADLPDF